MPFDLDYIIRLLERTPGTLNAWLSGLPEAYLHQNEGEKTWSPFDVIGHLIHGERTDWIDRLQIILEDGEDKRFKPFDRFAQFEESKGKTMQDLLDEFGTLRKKNVGILRSFKIGQAELQRIGIHPNFGEVTLAQLLSTWAVHDQNHIAQIARVLAHAHKENVGPWKAYLRIVKPVSA